MPAPNAGGLTASNAADGLEPHARMNFCLRQYAGLRSETLDNTAHKWPNAGRGNQHRRLAFLCRLLEFFADSVDELGKPRRLHGEAPIVALTDNGFRKSLFPFRGERDNRKQPVDAHVLGTELTRQPGPYVFGEHRRVSARAEAGGNSFEDGSEVADRYALGEQHLQHALDT